MNVILQVKISEKEYRKVELGNGMNYVETLGLSLAFINRFTNTITYIIGEKDTVRFEFGKNWYNVYINS